MCNLNVSSIKEESKSYKKFMSGRAHKKNQELLLQVEKRSIAGKLVKTFTKKEDSNISKNAEAMITLSSESSGKVDMTLEKANEPSGRKHKEMQYQEMLHIRNLEIIDRYFRAINYVDKNVVTICTGNYFHI